MFNPNLRTNIPIVWFLNNSVKPQKRVMRLLVVKLKPITIQKIKNSQREWTFLAPCKCLSPTQRRKGSIPRFLLTVSSSISTVVFAPT